MRNLLSDAFPSGTPVWRPSTILNNVIGQFHQSVEKIGKADTPRGKLTVNSAKALVIYRATFRREIEVFTPAGPRWELLP